MSTCRWGAGVSVAAFFFFPSFTYEYIHTRLQTCTTPINKKLLSFHLDLFVLTDAYECHYFSFCDTFYSNTSWHAAEKFDSFDQYAGKSGIRNPFHILAWGNCYVTMWWIILQGIWGGSLRSGWRERLFKIHVGECSGTRSDVNSNSAFVCTQWYGEKIPSTFPVQCTFFFFFQRNVWEVWINKSKAEDFLLCLFVLFSVLVVHRDERRFLWGSQVR